ncbi:MAG: FAD-binding oxidoreductase [Actinobacteria bacterium]|nr:FAD-binding oxidoreductase [Actinomycetota bacterium]
MLPTRCAPGWARLVRMTTIAFSPVAAALSAAGFVGRLVELGDDDYDAARSCWNGALDRQPVAIAYASDADDVAAAVRTCRGLALPFTIRAGGHSVAGRSIRDGALCIDLRGLNAIAVDPATRLVRVGGGTLLGELDAATQAYGLAVPAGQISHTGVGGLTLGGGIGWLMRKHGLTIDSLRALDVVLADGSRVRASEHEHPDLFWALRGGGDFGAVTTFTFEAREVGPEVLAGVLVYPWERARSAFVATRDLMAAAPEELTVFVVLATAPPGDPFPAELHGRPVAIVGVAWCGDPDRRQGVLQPLRAACPPLLDLVGPMPYVGLQTMLDATAPPGWNYYDRLHYLSEVSDAAIDLLLAEFERVPEPEAHVITSWLGGAIDRVAPGETAFGHRSARALSWLIGSSGERPLEPVTAWVRALWKELEPYSTGGVYVNALDAERSVREAYADDVWLRLVDVKRRYDPDGAFAGSGIR